MKFIWVSVLLFCESLVWAGDTRATNPSAVNVEIGGRGLIYSFSFDRVLSESLAAGIGIGTVSTQFPDGSSASQSATLFPMYMNYYFAQDAASLYATVGATLVTNASAISGLSSSLGGLKFSSSPLMANAGLGYEYRSEAGYLVRLTAYLLVSNNVMPWGGFSVGYSF